MHFKKKKQYVLLISIKVHYYLLYKIQVAVMGKQIERGFAYTFSFNSGAWNFFRSIKLRINARD